MLSLKDCLDFCDMDQSEISAIAEHEHIPVIVAAELCDTLLTTPDGVRDLHSMLLDNIATALEHGEMEKASALSQTYRHFQSSHPLAPSP
jgi:hypothetical protein